MEGVDELSRTGERFLCMMCPIHEVVGAKQLGISHIYTNNPLDRGDRERRNEQ